MNCEAVLAELWKQKNDGGADHGLDSDRNNASAFAIAARPVL